jgi:hypothetical protein
MKSLVARKQVFANLIKPKDHTKQLRQITFSGYRNNSKIGRLKGEIRDREKTMSGLKRKRTLILQGYPIYHNFIREHQALNGKTPAEACGIKVEGKIMCQHSFRMPNVKSIRRKNFLLLHGCILNTDNKPHNGRTRYRFPHPTLLHVLRLLSKRQKIPIITLWAWNNFYVYFDVMFIHCYPLEGYSQIHLKFLRHIPAATYCRNINLYSAFTLGLKSYI